jgi:hypothetical protein
MRELLDRYLWCFALAALMLLASAAGCAVARFIKLMEAN